MNHPAITRRRMLKGAGGACLALPLLRSLEKSAHAEASAPPKRLLLVYTPNGRIHDAWFPLNVVSETEFDLNLAHEPLAAFKDRLLILQGIDLKVTETGPGGPHQRGIGSLFSGRELLEGTFVDGCGSQAGWVNGITVDQEVANHVGLDTPLKSLELAVRGLEADVQSRISYAGPGQPLPPMNTPEELYSRMFNIAPGDAGEAVSLVRRPAVLDAVREQFSLLTPQLGAEDRQKLEQHLDLVLDVDRRLGIASSIDSCEPPAPMPTLAADSEDDMPQILELDLDLLAVAFACDLTRVASLQISTGQNRIRYPWVNSLGEGHTLSHAGPTNEGATQQLVDRERWHSGQLARFAERLASIPEGDGSVLDHTLILWGTEVSVGNTHALTNLPYLMLGSAGGYFRTGRFVQFSDVSNNDLLVSVLNAMGVEAQTFGHPDYVTGPLPGLTA